MRLLDRSKRRFLNPSCLLGLVLILGAAVAAVVVGPRVAWGWVAVVGAAPILLAALGAAQPALVRLMAVLCKPQIQGLLLMLASPLLVVLGVEHLYGPVHLP